MLVGEGEAPARSWTRHTEIWHLETKELFVCEKKFVDFFHGTWEMTARADLAVCLLASTLGSTRPLWRIAPVHKHEVEPATITTVITPAERRE